MKSKYKKLNPGILKLDLFCKGMRIDESCELEKDARSLAKIRAGLGSGLEIVLPEELYVNVPVIEHFVKDSPYLLIKREGKYYIRKNGDEICSVMVLPPPQWYFDKTSTGTVMSQVGVLQGTYLGIYPTKVCDYWNDDPPRNCRFCATGLNVGFSEKSEKSIKEVVETAKAAKRESKITMVHFNTGYYGGNELRVIEPYARAVKKETGLLVGIQCPPQKDLSEYDRFIDNGWADHFSFCYELHNHTYFKECCPGKEETLGQETFFKALQYTSQRMGKGKVSGEIIAGIEPVKDTLKAIDYITGIGAFPTICVFRPVQGTVYGDRPSPKFEDMVVIFRHMYEACKRNGIPTGIAPRVKVSIVVLPYEGRYFVEHKDLTDLIYAFKLAFFRAIYRPYFYLKMALHKGGK